MTLSKERVLVTGGAGFIGSHMVDKLISEGYDVVVLDNLHSGSLDRIKKHIGKDSFRFIKGDIRDKLDVKNAVKGADIIVHLAALVDVNESLKKPSEYNDVNVNGTLNLLEQSIANNVEKFIFASSAAVYGEAKKLPVKEDHPMRPISPYGASKAAAEQYCMAFYRSYGLKTTILRYFNVYGPRQENKSYAGVISRFIKDAKALKPLLIYGDGSQRRDFIHVYDVVRATLMIMHRGSVYGEVFNVCTGKSITIKELANIISKMSGNNSKVIYCEPKKSDIRENFGDARKIFEMAGFKAKIDLTTGLQQLIDSAGRSIQETKHSMQQ